MRARYILRRILGIFVMVFFVITVAFVIVRLVPGDPAALLLGPDAMPEDADLLRARLGLDRSIAMQYLTFLADILRGNLGSSIFFSQPVTSVLAGRAEPTIFLGLFSLVIAAPIGIYAAYRRSPFWIRPQSPARCWRHLSRVSGPG